MGSELNKGGGRDFWNLKQATLRTHCGQLVRLIMMWANAFHFTLATFSNDISVELQKHLTDLCNRAIFGKIYTAKAKLYIYVDNNAYLDKLSTFVLES